MKALYHFFRNLHFFITLVFSFTIHAQQKFTDLEPAAALERYITYQGLEKAYVHTDKDFYASGETIWIKTYLVNGSSHLKSELSRLIYLDFLNESDSLISRKKVYVERLGAKSEIQLDKKLKQGNYTLRAYTKYMLNAKQQRFFEKKIRVWKQVPIPNQKTENGSVYMTEDNYQSKNTSPNITFFPEGGHLIEGLESVIGIQVKDKTGQGLIAAGKIVDNEGKIVAFFESHEYGLGAFKLKPKKNSSYFATLSGSNEKIILPEALKQGYTMSLKNKGEHIDIQLSTTTKNGIEGAYLLGHLRGKVIFKQRIETKANKDSYRVKFLTTGLTDGVATFTLFSPTNEPVCERLVFIDRDDTKINLTVNSDFPIYGKRQRVATTINIVDFEGIPLQGSLSMTVATSDNLNYGKVGNNIESWLLLNSDLGASIPDAAYFFQDRTFARKYALDLLMMTHGWRRFVWEDLLYGEFKKPLAYPTEKGIMIQGKVTDFNNRYFPLKAALKLNILGLPEGIYQENGTTEADGKFSFGPFVFEDSINGFINAMALDKVKNKKLKELAVITDTVFHLDIASRPFNKKINHSAIPKLFNYLENVEKQRNVDFQFDGGVTQLEEVTVTEKRKTRRTLVQEALDELKKTTLYRNPDARLFVDSLPGTENSSVFDLLRRVPGVEIIGSYPNQSASIRGNRSFRGANAPLYLMDGAPVELEYVRFLRDHEFIFVDVLKGPKAGIFGSRAANGVVAIYSQGAIRLPPKPKAVPNVDGFTIAGFSKVREFYSPDYSVPKHIHQKPDYRTTLHWEPFVTLENEQSKSVSFYTGDNLGSYIIQIEGLTTDGRPVNGSHLIKVTDDTSKF